MDDADRHLLTLFSAALEFEEATARAAYLDEACAGSPGLRERVEALLRAHERPGRFLERDEPRDTVGLAAVAPASEGGPTARYEGAGLTQGSQVGPYRLLQVIGQGGMGTVYMAEQREPVRRTVALKVIRPGLDGGQILSRFEAERQALALMDHPNIARVLDAGTAPDGRPYFAMELVKGVPITRFCDERTLTPRERIELFIPICQAVQHAHQKGVIHRDLKPSNVLVALYDDKPVPKVIDFGVAKAAGTKLTEQTAFTEFGAVIGTLEYMSPEQAQLNQLDIDTRTDVYSLGILLYELLTGTTPMDRKTLGHAALLDMLRLIREGETPRPSARLSSSEGLPSIAAARGLEPRKLSGLVRGELDWIVMKALEKDRSRRYESASGLARDLRRHLDDEDVEATPPSAAYRFRKFARRHRVALSVASAIAGTLVIATAVSTWQSIRATRAERAAREAAEIERQTNSFFIGDLLGKADFASQLIGDVPPDPDLKVRTMVDRAAARLDDRLAGQPRVDAAVRYMIGRVYNSIGLSRRALPFLERSLEIRREQLGEGHPTTRATAVELATSEIELSRYDRAEARLRRTLALATQRGDEDSDGVITIQGVLASCLNKAGRYDEANSLHLQSLELARRDPKFHPSQRLMLQNNWATNLINLGKEKQAEALLNTSLEEALASIGETHPTIPLIRNNLALAQREVGQFALASTNANKALDGFRGLYGDRHRFTLAAMKNVVLCQVATGRLEEAEKTAKKQLDIASQAFGQDSEMALYAAIGLADVLRHRGKPLEAETLLKEYRASARRLGRQAENLVEGSLGLALLDMSRFAEAEQLFARVEADYLKVPSPSKRYLIKLQSYASDAVAGQGRHAAARERLVKLLETCRLTFDHDDVIVFYIIGKLASECRALGRLDESEVFYQQCIELGRRLMGDEARDVLVARQNYGALLHVRGRFEAAEAQYKAAIEALNRTQGPDHPPALSTLSNLGELYRDWGRTADAEPILERALRSIERLHGPQSLHTLWTLWKLAELERDRGRADKAEPMFRRCLAGYAKTQADDGTDLAALRADLAMNRLMQNEPREAETLLRAALRAYERQLPDDWRRFEIQGQLGEALVMQKRFEEAEPLILDGFQGLDSRQDRVTVDARPRIPQAGERVVRLYQAWGKPEKAADWRSKLKTQSQRSSAATKTTTPGG